MEFLDFYRMAVLLGGLGLLTYWAMRGHSIFVIAPLCALLVLMLSGADPIDGMTVRFMTGFADYVRNFFFIFCLGAAFGKLMDESGAAACVARAVVGFFGPRWACLSVVLACAVLTYGGVSLFVVGFSVFPLALQLFREADLPRRFIPASIAFGSVTFTMTSAGSPEIQNLIAIKIFTGPGGEALTDARAGWPVSIIVALFMFAVGQWYLETAIRRAVKKGERFESRIGDKPPFSINSGDSSISVLVPELPRSSEDSLLRRRLGEMSLLVALTPLVTTLLALNLFPYLLRLFGGWLSGSADGRNLRLAQMLQEIPDDPTVAIFLGVLAASMLFATRVPSLWESLSAGFINGLIAIGATSSIVGFGKALEGLPAFTNIVNAMTQIPGDPLIGAAIAVAVICGIAGSASGGQGLALPYVKAYYIEQLGVAPRALHRVVAIASGSLDTLPANSYLVMLIRNICGETHKSAYWPICVTCTLLPLVGTALAIALFKLFPAWGQM